MYLTMKTTNFLGFVKGFGQFGGKPCAYVVDTVRISMLTQKLHGPAGVHDVDEVA